MANNGTGRNHILYDDDNRPSWQAADERVPHTARPHPSRFEEREVERGSDDRFVRERGNGYWDDRSDRIVRSEATGYGFGDGNRPNRERMGTGGDGQMRPGPMRSTGTFGEAATGGHRGKGPKGFTRSDERVKECVSEALTDDDLVDATHIEIAVKDGEVTLTGSVEDRTMKRAAEACIDRIPGVKDIHNQLRIEARGVK